MVQLSTHDKEGSTMWTFRKMKAKVKVKVVAGHDAGDISSELYGD